MPTLFAWLLNAAYLVALIALSPAIAWQAWRTGKYRDGFYEKLFGRVPVRGGDRPCAWLHAVSVGEVNLLATTLREIQRVRPGWELVVSTTTKTGYDLAMKKYGPASDFGLTVFYCPLDFSWATDNALRRVRPDLLVLAELELWPNLIASAKRCHAEKGGARVAIVNGRLSDASFRGYSRVGWLLRRVLRQVDLVTAQDETTAERFRSLGAPRVEVTGSLKYDGATTDRDNPRTRSLRTLAGCGEEDVVWLAGSTQAPEEAICLRVFERLRGEFPRLRLVLVPRHPERFDEVAGEIERAAGAIANRGFGWARRSRLEDSAFRLPPSALLIDSVGELGAWWGVAKVGFVGGSFGDRGGQNMIEPAAYGVATCFGPNTWNFRDIVAALKTADGVREVADEAALEVFVRKCLEEPEFAEQLGARAKRFVATQLGATERTVKLLTELHRHDAAGQGDALSDGSGQRVA